MNFELPSSEMAPSKLDILSRGVKDLPWQKLKTIFDIADPITSDAIAVKLVINLGCDTPTVNVARFGHDRDLFLDHLINEKILIKDVVDACCKIGFPKHVIEELKAAVESQKEAFESRSRETLPTFYDSLGEHKLIPIKKCWKHIAEELGMVDFVNSLALRPIDLHHNSTMFLMKMLHDRGTTVQQLRDMVQELRGNEATKEEFEDLLVEIRIREYDRGALDIIFVGNPGVGKSTLLTSISGLRFQSGVSWGCGLTRRLEFQTNPANKNIRFCDTPGLADIEYAIQAAKEITEALQDGANQKRKTVVFFVVQCDGGRIRPTDLLTIEKVMESIKLPGGAPATKNCYAVIVNKMASLDKESFKEKGKGIIEGMFAKESVLVPFTTAHVFFSPFISHINDEENQRYHFTGLWEFITEFPGIQVESADVIDVNNLHQQLKEQAQRHQEELKRLENQTKSEMEALKMEVEKEKEELRAAHKEELENTLRLLKQEQNEKRAKDEEEQKRRENEYRRKKSEEERVIAVEVEKRKREIENREKQIECDRVAAQRALRNWEDEDRERREQERVRLERFEREIERRKRQESERMDREIKKWEEERKRRERSKICMIM